MNTRVLFVTFLIASGSVSVSAGGATVTYVPYAALPPHDNARMRWITGEVAVVKDNLGGDLIGFFKGDTSLHAAVSSDDGSTWNWVDPAVNVDVAMPNTLTQSADGRIHILSETLGLGYSRLALVRNAANHVVGFSAEVSNLVIPVPIEFGELRTQLVVGRDAAGNAALFYAVYDWAASTPNWGRIQAGKTTVAAGVAPINATDFVSLTNAPGASVIARFGGTDPYASPHNSGVGMAQHPVSRDLWFEYGPLDTADGVTSNTQPVVRQRAVPSGPSTWTLSGSQIVDGVSGGYASEIGPVVSTDHHVWFVRVSSGHGVVIDSADASGQITQSALPSPYDSPHLGAWTVFAMDAAETRAFAGGWLLVDSAVQPTTRWASYWNGSTWTRLPADSNLDNSNGMGRSAAWDQGLVLMMLDASSSFPYSGAPSFATIRLGSSKGDLNRDGMTDLVFHNTMTGQNQAWLMNGTTRIGSPATISPAAASLDWRIGGVDDFDGDERNDLVLWNRVSGATEIWLMNGTTRVGEPVPLAGTPAPPWRLSATADFNQDARPDLVWRNSTTQKLSIWTMNGTLHSGTVVPAPDQAVDANWEIVAALDYNGDRYTDFLWYNWSSGKIVEWLMNENVQRVTGLFTSPSNAGDANWKVLASGDYGIGPGGLPGTNDVVWRNATSGRSVIWQMDHAGNRTSGSFTSPAAPSPNPTDWMLVGPR